MKFIIATIAVMLQLSAQSASAQNVTPDPAAPISALRIRASVIYQRLTGVKLGIDSPLLAAMEAKLATGDRLGAAALVTGDKAAGTAGDANFYDQTIRQLAAKMSTREETVKAPLSDFVATFIGIVRDEADGRDLVRGSYFYQGNTTSAPNNQNAVADIIKSNNHYDAVDRSPASLRDSLVKVNAQVIANSGGTAVSNPDPAGVLTSRGFTQAHAIAGTNRRMVHYTFKQFLCVDMAGWATTDSPDNRVGPDVERSPGGDPSVFQKTCKGCHGNMDGMRGAFANIDFGNNHLKHGLVLTNQDNNGQNADNVGENNFARARFNNVSYEGVASKYVRNAQVFPGGYFTRDSSWINTATTGANAQYFGWRSTKDATGAIQGYGINQFGTMVGNSEAFSRCMVRRVYQQVCKRDVSQFEVGVVRSIATAFEGDNYNMKKLFQRVATSDACIGK